VNLRRLIVPIAIVALIAAACGDDSGSSTQSTPAASESQTGGDTPASGDDTPAPSGDDTPASSSTGGTFTLGDETITLDSARCYLQEQDAFGGGKILANAQGFGTNAAGEEVMLDFTRYDEDADFTGDDILVNVGDFMSGDSVEYHVTLDLGSVSIDGRSVSADGFTLTSFDMDPPGELESSFALSC